MGEAAATVQDRAATLIDQLADGHQALAAAQARQAALMLEFDVARDQWDRRRITDQAAAGLDPRYQPGEFAAMEIGLATHTSKRGVQQTIGIARRLREETPDAWQAWLAGDIDQLRAAKINHALLRLTRTSSKHLLNALVVPVAACKTAELLGRWLNAFIAAYEPDETDERLHRSLADRYVSLRPDLDGVSFLSAAMSSLDAAAIDQVLNALAGLAEPGDPRTLQQRRADALVDMLLGRVSNGCHVTWTDDDDPDTDDTDDDLDADHQDHRQGTGSQPTGGPTGEEAPSETGQAATGGTSGSATAGDGAAGTAAGDPADSDTSDSAACGAALAADPAAGRWEPDADFGLPASAFRADHRAEPHAEPRDDPHAAAGGPAGTVTGRAGPLSNPDRPGRPVLTPCPGSHPTRPLPVTIGVVVSVQSLFGYTDTPGQLADRSALVPADTIRGLARQPGTLFYRLLTDHAGNLLETTELGRFPSRKLGLAVGFRDGSCANPVCTVPAHRCDLDHIVPVPRGSTSADNLEPKCRTDHRAKTHAGHHTTRTQTATQWTTPTGHTYTTPDDPLPAENWPQTDDPVWNDSNDEPPGQEPVSQEPTGHT